MQRGNYASTQFYTVELYVNIVMRGLYFVQFTKTCLPYEKSESIWDF